MEKQHFRLKRWLLPAAAIAAAGGWIYAPAAGAGWIWDDNLYVTQNPLLRSAAGLRGIWSGAGGVNYFPITATCQWLQWHLWQDRPLGYHLTNIGLHLLSAFLLWRLLGRLLGSRAGDVAWLGGLLFAIHPMAVESVAWVAEIKNTLSLPPLLLAMLAWIESDEPGGTRQRFVPTGRRAYALALFWFLVALLCKSSVVMFPFVLLLYAWWRRGRLRLADLAASAPFFALSLVLGLVTLRLEAHQVEQLGTLPAIGIPARLAGAGLAAAFYFCKSAIPIGQLPIYPSWRLAPPSAGLFLPWFAIAAAGLWLGAGRASRAAWLGLGWFFVSLVPVLGIAGMAFMRIAPVSDHFAYLALPGLIGLAVAGLGAGLRRSGRNGRMVLWSFTAVAAAGMAVVGHGYARVFRDEQTLWSYALEHNAGAWMAHFNLANTFREQGRAPEAIAHYEMAMRLRPDAPEVHANYAAALALAGRGGESLAQSAEAVRLRPGYAEGHANLGAALAEAGRLPEAIGEFAEALRLKPDFPEAEGNLALALTSAGRPGEAIGHFEHALRLKPDLPGVANNLANAHFNFANDLVRGGRLPDALKEYEEALRISPRDREIRQSYAGALRLAGRTADAEAQLDEVLRLGLER